MLRVIVAFMKEPSQILKESLQERVAINPRYSLRAFARDLGVSPQQLSNVINQRKGLSEKAAEQIAEKLGFTRQQAKLFCASARAAFSRSKIQRGIAQEKLKHLESETGSVAFLEGDLFKIISNWYHFALLELIKMSGGRAKDVLSFSTRLNIPENEVVVTLARLERLKLISRSGSGWKVNQDTVISEHGIPPEAVRNFHRQILELGMRALTEQNANER